MRVLVVNDTGAGPNPGCRAVMSAINGVLSEAGPIESAHLPLGHRADAFRPIAARVSDYMVKVPGEFQRIGVPPLVNVASWIAIHESQTREDRIFADLLASAELVIVNGEGSIHHNLPRALALLSLMTQCGAASVPYILLNSTIQAVQPELLDRALSGAGMIHARESATERLLDDQRDRTARAPDLAVLATGLLHTSRSRPRGRRCLVTGGVAGVAATLSPMFRGIRERGYEPVYFRVGDGGEGPTIADACAADQVAIVEAGTISSEDVLDYLSEFALAISGRHHINLFLMAAGTPFVPLPSNTWKIQATLTDLSYPVPIAASPSEALSLLDKIAGESDAVAQSMMDHLDRAIVEARRFKAELLSKIRQIMT